MKVIKWVRRNNKKIMAFVVIGCLFAFIGGGELLQLLSRNRTQAIGRFADNRKISNLDLRQARQELEVLTGLGIPMFLRSQQIHGVLLAELLFSERKPQPQVVQYLNQMIMGNQYRVTDRQLAAVYKGTVPGAYYWLLLSHEAQQAGLTVSNAAVGQMLGEIIPKIFGGRTYGQVVRAMMGNGMSEKEILTTCGKLMAVLQYAQLMCTAEDVTCSQLDHLVSWDNETLDVNAVALEAGQFTKLLDPNRPAAEDRLREQFNRYKGYFAGQITDDNPFGFGYKLPARVQVEYLVVRVDDVLPLVPRPTQEEAEEYYHRNIQVLFTRQVKTDPNDPNSPTKDVVRSFAEVADEIQRRWVSEKAMDKTLAILQEARNAADLPLAEQGAKKPNLNELRQKAPPYRPIADELTAKHKVKVYAGQTGLLSLEDMTGDRILGRLVVTGRTQSPVPLARVLFAVDPVDMEDLMMVGAQKPRPYESIGPAQSQRSDENVDVTGQAMAVVRIVEAIETREAADVNETYDNTVVVLDPAQGQTPTTFSMREKVAQDVRQLDAFELAKTKGRELVAMVKADGWTKALDQLNQSYRQQAGLASTEPNVFALRPQAQRRRISTGQVQMWAIRSEQDPMAQRIYRNAKAQKVLGDQLYGLIPAEQDSLADTPAILESQAQRTVYCVRDLAVKRFSLQDYAKARALYAFQEDHIQSQSLAAIHFSPAHIVERMHFQSASEESQSADANNAPSK